MVTEGNISEVIASASNIVEAAEYSLKSGKVKQVIAPSYDSGTAARLRQLANTELKKARDKNKWGAAILVGEHTDLKCDGQTRVQRFTSDQTHHFARQIRSCTSSSSCRPWQSSWWLCQPWRRLFRPMRKKREQNNR